MPSFVTHASSPLLMDEGNPQSNLDFSLNQPAPRPKLSLRLKATLFAIAISALPVLGVGISTYLVDSHLSQENTEKLEQQLATKIQVQLNQLMAERAGDVQIIAGLDVFAEADLRQGTTPEEKNRILERFLKAYPLYDSIAAFDLDGDPIAQTKGEPLGNHRNRSYIQEAIRTQKVVLSQPTVSTSSKVVSVYAAAPIKDNETGQVVGVVRLRVPVENLIKLLSPFQTKSSRSYYLLNGAGEIFYSSQGLITSGVNSSGAKVAPNDRSAQSTNTQTRAIETIFPAISPFTTAQKPGSVVATNPLGKVEQLVTYIPPIRTQGLSSLKWQVPDLTWSVVLTTDTAEAFASQRTQLLLLLLGTGLTAAVVSALAIYFVNRTMRPVLDAAQTVERLGQGELNTRVQVRGNDELTTLGNNINRMADRIQVLLQTLRQNADQMQQQNDVLAQLSQNEALIQGNAKAAAPHFTHAIAHTLQVEQVGIWLYQDDRSVLICLDQYDLSSQQHSQPASLFATDWPDYFHRLATDPLIRATDVQTERATSALFAAGQLAAGTRSLLNLPIQLGARTIGVIRCDHHTPRTWQAEELTFIASIANLVSIVLESDWQQQEVNHVLDVVCDVEEGDLTTQARVSDRTIGLVADTFNRLVERFAQILHQVLDAAQQVSRGAMQQTQLVATVTLNAQQQAQAVTQVLELSEQVQQAAQTSAQTVQTSSESLQTTASTVAQGQAVIEALTQEIAMLQAGSDRIMQRMKTLGEFVGMADQFVQDQSQIAFITQTLALNASLVAARASEQRDPRQFIVVAREFDSIADQVSKLAQQTHDGLGAIEQRSAQIHQVVSAVDADVQGLGELVRRFSQGVEQSNQVFNQVQAVMATAVQVGETVTVSSQDIVTAAHSTAEAMREIAKLAANNTQLTQQTQVQFEQMDALSTHLLQSIQFFQLPAAPVIEPLVNPEDNRSSEPEDSLTEAIVEMAGETRIDELPAQPLTPELPTEAEAAIAESVPAGSVDRLTADTVLQA